MKVTTGSQDVQWIWRHIALSLPADWEMLQLSSEFTRGRCAFADRYQYRLELNWNIVKGEPDYERMVGNYMGRLEQEKKLADGVRHTSSGWHGFYGMVSGDMTSRFGRYLGEIGCLVEVVFLWPEARDAGQEAGILHSLRAQPPRHGMQDWRAFGLEMHVPATAAFEGCTAQPAKAEFTFSNPKSGNSWQFARYGMVSSWFGGDLERWMRGSLGKGAGDLRFCPREVKGAHALRADGTFKPEGLHIKRGKVGALAWICPEDGRLYCAKQWIRREGEDEAGSDLEHMLVPAPAFTPT